MPKVPADIPLYELQDWPSAQYINVVCQSCNGHRYEGDE
jgi:hypothetical protein